MSQKWSLSKSDMMRLDRTMGREVEEPEATESTTDSGAIQQEIAQRTEKAEKRLKKQNDLLHQRMRTVEQENRLGLEQISADLSSRFNQLSMDTYDKIALLDRNQGTMQEQLTNLFDISSSLFDEVESLRKELKETKTALAITDRDAEMEALRKELQETRDALKAARLQAADATYESLPESPPPAPPVEMSATATPEETVSAAEESAPVDMPEPDHLPSDTLTHASEEPALADDFAGNPAGASEDSPAEEVADMAEIVEQVSVSAVDPAEDERLHRGTQPPSQPTSEPEILIPRSE